MTLERARVSALAIALALTMALPAAAQNRQPTRQQPAQPAAPAQPEAPPAPAAPQPGPNTLVVSHTLHNMTQQAVQVQIRMDGKDLFSGRLDGRRAAAPEDEPSPQIQPVVAFDIQQEQTLFWEVIYTAIADEPARPQQQQQTSRPQKPKFCRQAWTAVVAPGQAEPTIVVPVQQVNRFGECDFMIQTNDEGVYNLDVRIASAPR